MIPGGVANALSRAYGSHMQQRTETERLGRAVWLREQSWKGRHLRLNEDTRRLTLVKFNPDGTVELEPIEAEKHLDVLTPVFIADPFEVRLFDDQPTA